MADEIQGQVKIRLGIGQAGQAARSDGDAVIAAQARDEFLLLWRAPGVVEIPHHLDCRVVGFRTGVGKKYLGKFDRRNFLQQLGQINGRMHRLAAKALIIRQGLQLFRRRVDQFLFAKPERGAPQSGQPLDIFLAAFVGDIDAPALGDDMRAGDLVRRQIGIGVQIMCDVPAFRRIAAIGHRFVSFPGASANVHGIGLPPFHAFLPAKSKRAAILRKLKAGVSQFLAATRCRIV